MEQPRIAKKLSPLGEAFHGIKPGAVAVGPVVVARQEDDRMLEPRELALACLKPLVGAGPPAGSNVTDMRDESEVAGIQVVDQRIEALHLRLGVRRIAGQRETQRARRRRLQRRAAGEKNQNQGQTPILFQMPYAFRKRESGCAFSAAFASSPMPCRMCRAAMGQSEAT